MVLGEDFPAVQLGDIHAREWKGHSLVLTRGLGHSEHSSLWRCSQPEPRMTGSSGTSASDSSVDRYTSPRLLSGTRPGSKAPRGFLAKPIYAGKTRTEAGQEVMERVVLPFNSVT